MGELNSSAASVQPAVSVIIACRNGAETLGAALDSLGAQDFGRPWEVVFADNDSTDGSRAIFEAWAARHPEIAARALDVPERGKSHALNAAIRAARGGGILFCDADDTLAPGYLTAMAAALDRHPFVAARLDPHALNPDWIREARPHPQETRLSRLPHAPHCDTAGGGTFGFRREVFDAVGDFDPAYLYLEDTEYCVRAYLQGFELRLVPDAVYNYRYRENLEEIYRQNYNYHYYRALLRRQYAGEPFLISGRWLRLLGVLARQTLSREVNRVLGRQRGPYARARFNRLYGRLVGDLMGSLAYGVAPPGPCVKEGVKPARPAARHETPLWRRGLNRALGTVFGSLTAVRTSEALMALTFDDGPDPASTPAVLDALARHGMRATFFLVGSRAARHPELMARIVAEGHEIGNHSWDHPTLPLLPSDAVARQIRRTRAALAPHALMRPPYGAQSLRTHLLARRQGYRVVTWSVAGGDWRADDAATLAGRIAASAAPGAIVLLHDTLYSFEQARYRDRAATIGALELLARRLPRYRFVTVSELLRHGRPVRRYWAQAPEPERLAALATAEAS